MIIHLEQTEEHVRIPFLRQQIAKREGRPNMCLADFVSHDGDWIGGFSVAIHGIEPHLARFKAEHDDYNDILLKALADRFAEALAERLHQHVRTTLWGYAPGEQLTNAALIREELRRNPTLLGLEKLMSARLPLAEPEIRPDVELAKTIIQGYTKRLSRYRCDNCGFKARQFYWRCPACGGWETYPPRRSEEFDQTL